MAHAQAASPLTLGRPAPTLDAEPASLALALPTAMLLVDYAARGNTVPTAWPQTAAQEVDPGLLEKALAVRAVLGHGDGLRAYLLPRLPAGHAAHRDWEGLRSWLVGMDVAELIDFGIQHNVTYGERLGFPLSDEDVRTLAAAERAPAARRRELRLRWLLKEWGVPKASARAESAADPGWFGATLLELLDAIVAAGFEETWIEAEYRLAESLARLEPAPAGLEPRQWVTRVSGLRIDDRWLPWLNEAARVVVMPCPHLGNHLTVFETLDEDAATVWVGFEPTMSRRPPVRETAGDVGGLASLGRQIVVMGDQTRLSMLLVLARREQPTAQLLADELGIHLSTVSRQLGQLERAGLLVVTRDGPVRRYDVDRTAIRTLARALEHALG
ncbi:ArsR/SmtB family transcription factor [Tenggerimyces flavus]|uniref:ArsR/SmtB family transcription factor n=1 Tax=Tenggerimyces flavus TaxID=1708749 RepID=A0ABV7YEF2_9ACTN|nr:winged helix-turn-helix domain-containing protein [Tenggerimyces flavus]MBM7786095.1 DNA-binding transcriptional ArsR family regulator [Tenggerimyces flavus]